MHTLMATWAQLTLFWHYEILRRTVPKITWDCIEIGSCHIDLASGLLDSIKCRVEDHFVVIPSILKDRVTFIAKCNSYNLDHVNDYMVLAVIEHYCFALPGD